MITPDEMAALENAAGFDQDFDDNRERCTICGMVANIDPSLHTERYGHVPEVYRDGQRLRFDFQTYTFAQIGVGR